MIVLMELAFLNNLTYTFHPVFKKDLNTFGSVLLIVTIANIERFKINSE